MISLRQIVTKHFLPPVASRSHWNWCVTHNSSTVESPCLTAIRMPAFLVGKHTERQRISDTTDTVLTRRSSWGRAVSISFTV